MASLRPPEGPSDPVTIGMLWVGPPLSVYEELSLRSVADAGHPVHLFTYDELPVPPSVIRRDASEVIDRRHVFRNTGKTSFSFALFSNVFRYRMLATSELVWLDADIVVRHALRAAPYLYAWQDPGRGRLNGALLGAPSGSPLVARLLAESEGLLEDEEAREVPWGTYGPRLVTRIVKELGLEHHALPAEEIYPIRIRERWRLFDPRSFGWCEERMEGARALHLFNSKLQASGVKHLAPPRGSYLHHLMLTHDVPLPRERLSMRWVRRQRDEQERRITLSGRISAVRGRLARLARLATRGGPRSS